MLLGIKSPGCGQSKRIVSTVTSGCKSFQYCYLREISRGVRTPGMLELRVIELESEIDKSDQSVHAMNTFTVWEEQGDECEKWI